MSDPMIPENETATDEIEKHLSETIHELYDRYDGAPDSKTLWMGTHIHNLEYVRTRWRSEQAERKRLAEIVEKFQVHEYEILYDIIQARKLHDNCKPIDGFLQQMEIGARAALATGTEART